MAIFRSLKFWLIISLALNFMAVGILVGLKGHGGKPPPRAPNTEIGAIIRSIPEARRDELTSQFRNEIADRRKKVGDFEPDIFAEIIGADPFMPDALEAAFENQRARNDGIAKRAHLEIIDVISEMTPDERAQMAERLRSFLQKRGKSRDGDRR